MTNVNVTVDANLLVFDGANDVPLQVAPDVGSPTGYRLPVTATLGGETVIVTIEGGSTVALDAATLAALETINAVVSGTVTVGNLPAVQEVDGTVALDATTLAALENIVVSGTVDVGNFPVDYPDATAATKLDAILTELAQKLEAGQEIALSASTLAALESITAAVTGTVSVDNFPASQPVSGTVALDGPTLAALEQITVAIQAGQLVGLDATTLAALESITATVSNFPAEYPLPAAQVTTLTPQTDALTDVELRASAVPVTTGHPTIAEPVVGNTVSTGDLTVVAAPGAGFRLVVRYLYTLVDPDATTTPVLHWKSSSGSYDLFRGFAISKTWTWSLPENEGLVLNLSESTDASGAVYTVFYAQEAI